MKVRTLIIAGLAVLGIGMMASCKSNTGNDTAKAVAQQTAIDSLKMEIVKNQIIDSMNMAAMPVASPVAASPVGEVRVITMAAEHKTVVHKKRHSTAGYKSHSYAGNTRHNTSYTAQNDTYAPSYDAPATATQPIEAKTKKGWNSKLKGSVIGTGAGAIAGAMIDKKKGRGALIGGLLGAGAGLGIGAILDRR